MVLSFKSQKLGLILYGYTNSGKSLLDNLLTSMYNVWDIGVFSCLPGTQVNQFYLDGLLNMFIYRSDEIVFEHLSVVLIMKNLLEGSKILNTDIKHKSKQHISTAPVIINMNGSSITSYLNGAQRRYLLSKPEQYFTN